MTKALWIASIIGIMAIAAILYFVNPETAAWLPKCPFHAFTGWSCPGCGTTRAIHACLHLKLGQALHYNFFLILSLPLLAAVAFTTYSHSQLAARLKPVVQHQAVLIAYIALFFIWWIVRNLLQI